MSTKWLSPQLLKVAAAKHLPFMEVERIVLLASSFPEVEPLLKAGPVYTQADAEKELRASPSIIVSAQLGASGVPDTPTQSEMHLITAIDRVRASHATERTISLNEAVRRVNRERRYHGIRFSALKQRYLRAEKKHLLWAGFVLMGFAVRLERKLLSQGPESAELAEKLNKAFINRLAREAWGGDRPPWYKNTPLEVYQIGVHSPFASER